MVEVIFYGISFDSVYLEDEVVLSKHMEEETDHLRQIFNLIPKNGLKLKIYKCWFSQSEVELLGQVVNMGGISVGSKKVEAFNLAAIRQTTTEL